MNTVDKAVAQAIATEAKEALSAILAKHGMEASGFKWSYGDWMEVKLTAVPVQKGENGVNLSSKEAQYYTKFGWEVYSADFSECIALTAPLGTRFNAGRPLQDYAFAGVDSKKRKNPIVAIDLTTGKTVYFAETVVTRINLAAEQQKAGA